MLTIETLDVDSWVPPVRRIFHTLTHRLHEMSLPKLTGVSALTMIEIKKDLREVERYAIQDDSDSDSSVRSRDVPPSSYPVRPRKGYSCY